MGLLILIVPIIIYFLILRRVLRNYDETKKRLKKRTLFILLFTLPFWDHIIGYGVYKYLCYTDGGVKIYKTVTDEQEQRDYWFLLYDKQNIQQIPAIDYGLIGHSLLTKDLKRHKTVYSNFCQSKKWKSYDCQKVENYIQKYKLKIYPFSKESMNIPRSKLNKDYIEKNGSSLKAIYVIGENELERAYLNYCNKKYDTLSIKSLNYKFSCLNAKKIIHKYNLNNVIKVPTKPYYFAKNLKNHPLFFIKNNHEKLINSSTNQIIAESKNFIFYGGIYIHVVNVFRNSGFQCQPKRLYDIQSKVIPNPYIIDQ